MVRLRISPLRGLEFVLLVVFYNHVTATRFGTRGI